MRFRWAMAAAAASCLLAAAAHAQRSPMAVSSPDGRVGVRVEIDAGGEPRYVVSFAGRDVLRPSRLGLVRDDADLSAGLRLTGVPAVERVADDYEMLTAKRGAIVIGLIAG